MVAEMDRKIRYGSRHRPPTRLNSRQFCLVRRVCSAGTNYLEARYTDTLAYTYNPGIVLKSKNFKIDSTKNIENEGGL
jgi:hypothetical protein